MTLLDTARDSLATTQRFLVYEGPSLHPPYTFLVRSSRSRSRTRRSRIRLLCEHFDDDDDDDVVVVVRAIERLIRRGHRGDQPLPEKTSSRLILPNIIFVGISPPPLSADRESPPPSLLGQARRRSLRTLVRLAASLPLFLSFSLSANEIPFIVHAIVSARYRKCSLVVSFRVRRARSSRRR